MGHQNNNLHAGFLVAVLWDTVFSGHVFRYKHHSPTLAVGNLECTLATRPKMRSLRHTDKLPWGDKLPCVSCPATAVCTDVVRCLQGKTCDSVICFCHRLSIYTVSAHQLIGGHFFSTFILPGPVVFCWLIWQALCRHSLWMAGSLFL